MTEFYIIIIAGGIALAYEISNKIALTTNRELTPIEAKGKDGENILLVPISKLEDAEGIKLPIGLPEDFEFNLDNSIYTSVLNADSIEFSFIIKKIEGTDIGEYTNVVIKIYWQYVLKAIINGVEKTSFIDKVTTFSGIDSNSFIDYNNLKKEDFISWIESKTNINSLREILELRIMQEDKVKELPLPYLIPVQEIQPPQSEPIQEENNPIEEENPIEEPLIEEEIPIEELGSDENQEEYL